MKLQLFEMELSKINEFLVNTYNMQKFCENVKRPVTKVTYKTKLAQKFMRQTEWHNCECSVYIKKKNTTMAIQAITKKLLERATPNTESNILGVKIQVWLIMF